MSGSLVAAGVTPLPTGAPRPSGARRISPAMLEARDLADSFVGLPRGTAKPLHYLSAFQEAAPYLGLPDHGFIWITSLVKMTRSVDWEEGSRPIAWPSMRLQVETLGVSVAQAKALNSTLFELGVIVINDSEQGKRYGRRGPDGRIIEAYGFDLSPLVLRYEEFVRLAARAQVEREHMRHFRKRATIARRGIRQAGEMLADLGPMPADWSRLEAETAGLVAAVGRVEVSEDLAFVVAGLERRQSEAEQWVRDQKPSYTYPSGPVYKPHNRATNADEDPKDTVVAQETGGPADGDTLKPQASSPPPSPPLAAPVSVPAVSAAPVTPERVMNLRAPQLLDLAPRLAHYVLSATPTWRDLFEAAATGLRLELGISLWLWAEACGVMGREGAALALALVSTKDPSHFRSSVGGYFAGMVKKAKRGELHLEGTLWALREAKWGKPDRRQLN
jgi:replication initiation protein RepC